MLAHRFVNALPGQEAGMVRLDVSALQHSRRLVVRFRQTTGGIPLFPSEGRLALPEHESVYMFALSEGHNAKSWGTTCVPQQMGMCAFMGTFVIGRRLSA